MRVILPFKDQTSANAVKRQMCDLSHKIGTTLQPVFTSRKLEQDLKPRLGKSSPQLLIDNVWFTLLHVICVIQIILALQPDTSTNALSNINILRLENTAHGDTSLLKESQFRILKKCQGKFDCLIYEMLFIKKQNPSLYNM